MNQQQLLISPDREETDGVMVTGINNKNNICIEIRNKIMSVYGTPLIACKSKG